MSGGRQNLVAATQRVLTHDLGRHIRIARLGEIAIRCPANEATFALRVIPARRFTVCHHWRERRALSLISAISTRSALMLLLLSASALSAATTTAALSAATALIASATSVVTIIAIALLALLALSLALSAIAATATLIRLRIVLRLLLRMWRSASAVV
jgi:hypothetical protein